MLLDPKLSFGVFCFGVPVCVNLLFDLISNPIFNSFLLMVKEKRLIVLVWIWRLMAIKSVKLVWMSNFGYCTEENWGF
jgi:hypothetical protein